MGDLGLDLVQAAQVRLGTEDSCTALQMLKHGLEEAHLIGFSLCGVCLPISPRRLGRRADHSRMMRSIDGTQGEKGRQTKRRGEEEKKTARKREGQKIRPARRACGAQAPG